MNEFFKNLFMSKEEKLKIAKEEVDARRQASKDNLAGHLREKLFFTDDEIQVIWDIIDDGMRKFDEIQNSTDMKNYGLISSQALEMELLKAEKEMLKNVENKIKETMRAKAERAKKYFNKG